MNFRMWRYLAVNGHLPKSAKTMLAELHSTRCGSQAGPPGMMCCSRRRIRRQRRGLLQPREQLLARGPASSPRPADYARTRSTSASPTSWGPTGARHQITRTLFGGGRKPVSWPTCTAGRERRMYVDPFFGGELLNEADVRRRIEATTGPRCYRRITIGSSQPRISSGWHGC